MAGQPRLQVFMLSNNTPAYFKFVIESLSLMFSPSFTSSGVSCQQKQNNNSEGFPAPTIP